MIELHLKLPLSIYDQLQASAMRQNKSIDDFMVELICQRFSLPIPSIQTTPVWAERSGSLKNERECSYCYRFVTDWALPEDDP
jgi:hypothetical protein